MLWPNFFPCGLAQISVKAGQDNLALIHPRHAVHQPRRRAERPRRTCDNHGIIWRVMCPQLRERIEQSHAARHRAYRSVRRQIIGPMLRDDFK